MSRVIEAIDKGIHKPVKIFVSPFEDEGAYTESPNPEEKPDLLFRGDYPLRDVKIRSRQ
jgi:hypothetical protein